MEINKKDSTEYISLRHVLMILVFMTIIIPATTFSQTTTRLYDLTVNYSKNPIGIERENIKFSWKIKSNIIGLTQNEYQIKVKDISGKEIWNSGVVKSSLSVGIPYKGPALSLESRYSWSVSVNSSTGDSITSDPAFFETGTDFRDAEWISYSVPAVPCFNASYEISMSANIINGGFSLYFGIKNDANKFVWNFTEKLLMSGKSNINGITWLNTTELESLIQANTPFDLKVSVNEKNITTFINGQPISEIENRYTIENPYIGLMVAAAQIDRRTKELRSSAQSASFSNVMINIDGYTEAIGERTFALSASDQTVQPTSQQGFMPFSNPGNTFLQTSYRGEPVKYIPESTLSPMFRTEKALTGQIASARLYISSLGIYDAYINGRKVMMKTSDGKQLEDVFGPGWTNYNDYIYYRTYDVTEYINSRDVTLGVRIGNGWYAGIIGRQYYGEIGKKDINELSLIAQLVIKYTDGSSSRISTNTTDWKASDKSPILLNDFFIGEVYDSRLESAIDGWNNTGFRDTNWGKVSRLNYEAKLIGGNENTAFMLESDRIYPVNSDETFLYDPENIIMTPGLKYGEVAPKIISPTKEMLIPKGQRLILDMGQNIAGVTYISFSGPKDTKVQIRGAEMLNDGKDNTIQNNSGSCGPKGTLYWYGLTRGRASEENWYTDTYFMNEKAIQNYIPTFTFHGFRYLEIWADSDITIHEIYSQPITSAIKQSGNIITNNENVNKLFENILWSQKGNYLTIPTDCPNRSERLGWSGDVNVFSETALFNFDVVNFLNNYMQISKNHAANNGGYFGTTMPGVSSGKGSSNAGWTDVAITLAWNLYLQTGDKDFLERNYDMLKKYMSLIIEDGLRAGYGDWVAFQATSGAYMAAMYQAYDAQIMEKIASVLGHHDDAETYSKEYFRIIKEMQSKYLDEKSNILSVTADNITRGGAFGSNIILDNSQTSILWALKMRLYRSDEEKNIFINNLLENINNSENKIRSNAAEKTLSTGFLGVNVLMPILNEIGLTQTAYDLLLQDEMPSWLYEVKLGATTTWERWNAYSLENSFGDYGMNSFNHYAYGAVGEWMFEYMAGIQKDETNPGFKNVILQPSIDNGFQFNRQPRINYVKGSYESYYGQIISSWTAEKDFLTSYEAIVPANTTATLYLPVKNDFTVQRLKKVKIPGVVFSGVVKHNNINTAKFQLVSGGYKFEYQKGKLVVNLSKGYTKE